MNSAPGQAERTSGVPWKTDPHLPRLQRGFEQQRVAFNEVKGLLRKEEGVQYGLLYPACQRISFNGQVTVFESPQTAKDFIQTKIRPAQ